MLKTIREIEEIKKETQKLKDESKQLIKKICEHFKPKSDTDCTTKPDGK